MKPGVLQSVGSQSVGHDLVTEQQQNSFFTFVVSLLTHLLSKALSLSCTHTPTHTHQQPAQGPKGISNSVYELSLKIYSTSIFQLIDSNLSTC